MTSVISSFEMQYVATLLVGLQGNLVHFVTCCTGGDGTPSSQYAAHSEVSPSIAVCWGARIAVCKTTTQTTAKHQTQVRDNVLFLQWSAICAMTINSYMLACADTSSGVQCQGNISALAHMHVQFST